MTGRGAAAEAAAALRTVGESSRSQQRADLLSINTFSGNPWSVICVFVAIARVVAKAEIIGLFQ
jgi:hypothetical protein